MSVVFGMLGKLLKQLKVVLIWYSIWLVKMSHAIELQQIPIYSSCQIANSSKYVQFVMK